MWVEDRSSLRSPSSIISPLNMPLEWLIGVALVREIALPSKVRDILEKVATAPSVE